MDNRLYEILDVLISHPTVSPPARNTAALQQKIAKMLKHWSFEVEQYPLYPGDVVLVATLKGKNSSAPKIILNGHIDVAYVDDESNWQTDPFKLTEVGEWLYGRGVSDMKGGFASLLYVLEKLFNDGITPEGDIIIQSVVGEEVGEAGTKLACEHSPQADLSLVLDTSHHTAQGQGGVITGWITVKSRETIHDGARRKIIHAGGGHYGASAIEKMVKVIQALRELEQHWAVTKSYPGMPAGSTIINPAVIEGGRHPAFIADECRLWITVHYLPDEDVEEIVAELESYLNQVAAADVWLRENPLIYTWGGSSMIEDKGEIFPSFTLPLNHPGFKKLQQAHESVHQQSLKTSISSTVTDGGWLHSFGIPTILYGPGELTEAHSVNEKIRSQELEQFSEVLYKFLKDWYQHPVKSID